MSKNMIEEDLHAYGVDFNSLEEIEKAVSERKARGETPLRGAAVFWPIENGIKIRCAVRILSDGSPSFAHAEYF